MKTLRPNKVTKITLSCIFIFTGDIARSRENNLSRPSDMVSSRVSDCFITLPSSLSVGRPLVSPLPEFRVRRDNGEFEKPSALENCFRFALLLVA